MLFVTNRQFFPATPAPCCQYLLPATGFHPRAKPVFVLSLFFAGLVCSFHLNLKKLKELYLLLLKSIFENNANKNWAANVIKIEAEVNSYFNLGRFQSKQCINNHLISAGAETKTVNYP